MFFDRLNVSFIRSYCYLKYVIKNEINLFGPRGPFGPEPSMILAPVGSSNILQRLWNNPVGEKESPSFLDNIFFAVPKQRKTIERRLKARFGDDRFSLGKGAKMFKRRLDLIVCETCGNYREKLRLCLHCFNRVEEESRMIKLAIAKQYGLTPVDKPWEIRYQDDPKKQVNNNILIEVEKERPVWFTKGLLQKANEVIPETSVITTETKKSNN